MFDSNGANKSSFSHWLYLFYNPSPARQHDGPLFPAVNDKTEDSLIQFNCPAAGIHISLHLFTPNTQL